MCSKLDSWTLGFLILAASSGFAMSSGPAIMRCYCNLPECIDRGDDSCKSRTGCFQELPHYNLPQPLYRRLNVGKGQAAITPVPNMDLRFGCLELWPSDSAPFQCTEPGSRKSPLPDAVGGQRHPSDESPDDDSDDADRFYSNSRFKFGDRSAIGRRKLSANRHNHHNKPPESRRWNAYDVPLRCCVGDMCNRRNFILAAPKSSSIGVTSTASPQTDGPIVDQTSATSVVTSNHWWFTSTMIFVPVIGGVTFFLLVVVGCWILHSGGGSACGGRSRSKLSLDAASISVPAHYYFYDASGVRTLANGDSTDKNSLKSCKCVVVEAAGANFSNMGASGRCVHVLPIVLAKYPYGDCVVVKPDTRTLVR